jgi:predicted aspartyl protease
MAFMRSIPALALSAAFLCAPAARAQDQCGPLKIVNIIHMFPTLSGDGDIVPIVIGGKPRNFLLDTGGYLSQISRPLAEELKLTITQSRSELYDVTGNVSRDQVNMPEFHLGEMTDNNVSLMVSPGLGTVSTRGLDGILAPDRLRPYEAELDFSTDTLNLFSPDHCPGHVVYWSAPAVATVPITLEAGLNPDGRLPFRGPAFHIIVPVMLDGHELKALVDTGATGTSIRMDLAERLFGLTMGDAETPQRDTINGDAAFKTYNHQFKHLSFGDVAVENARLAIIPNVMGRNADLAPLVAGRTKTQRDLINTPEMIIGMDVLRRLRIYFAFGEGKMYISPSSAPPVGTVVPYSDEFLVAMLKRLDSLLSATPDDAPTLNDRCFWRGIAKADLDGALADCDKSLKLAPGIAATLDSRAFVLFQMGHYEEALNGYDAALRADARQAPSLFMRGLTRGKLGDTSGKNADVAAATKDDPTIPAEFKRIGIED